MADSIRLFIAITILLAACSTPREQATPTHNPGAPASVQLEVSVSPTVNNQASATIVIEGTVESASPSARIIMLTHPVEGIEVIVLSEAVLLRDEQGNEHLVNELQPGMEVRAVGEPGGKGALLAAEVLMLD